MKTAEAVETTEATEERRHPKPPKEKKSTDTRNYTKQSTQGKTVKAFVAIHRP